MNTFPKVGGLLALLALGITGAFSARATAAQLSDTATTAITAGQEERVLAEIGGAKQVVVYKMVCLETEQNDGF